MFIYAKSPELDSIGRVIDFSVLKEKAGKWIDENWDHNTIIYDMDIEVISALSSLPRKKEPFIFNLNPTAENMAEYFLKVICPQIFKEDEITVYKIELWETENCKVEVTLN